MGMLSTGFRRAAKLLPAIEDSRKEDAWTGNGPDINIVIEDSLVLGTHWNKASVLLHHKRDYEGETRGI
jgi:hypothetical protein